MYNPREGLKEHIRKEALGSKTKANNRRLFVFEGQQLASQSSAATYIYNIYIYI